MFIHESPLLLWLQVPVGRVLSGVTAVDNSDQLYFARLDDVLGSNHWLKNSNFSFVNLFNQISILREPG